MTGLGDAAAGPFSWGEPGGARHLVVGGALVVAAVALGLGIALGAGNRPLPLDVWWMARMLPLRTPALLEFGFVMNWAGGGWFAIAGLPLAVVALLLLARRPWGALCFAACELLSVGAVQLLKQSLMRPRPEELFTAADAGSFPSGHVANAATIALALCVLFPRLWVGLAGVLWVVLMAFSRTLLGAHWLSDTAGGALVGAGVALVLAAAFAAPLRRERHAAAARRRSSGPTMRTPRHAAHGQPPPAR